MQLSKLYYPLTGNYSPTSPTFPHEIVQELNKFCTYHNINQPTFSILKIKTSPDELVYIAICRVQNLSFNGTSNTYPAAKIYAAIKALQKIKIENVLHLPSITKRTYHPTENTMEPLNSINDQPSQPCRKCNKQDQSESNKLNKLPFIFSGCLSKNYQQS